MNDIRQPTLAALQRSIRACTRCVEAGYLAAANPIFRGREGNRQMVIGQAPGPRADHAGGPWPGASGTLLRTWFGKAGFDPEWFHDDWYFTSLTKCFPGKAKSGAGDRAPSAVERALCRPHLEAEIALVRPRLVVTLGRLAAGAIVPGAKGLTLRDLVGSVHPVDLGYGSVPVVPLPHPSGIGGWLNDPDNRALVDVALAELGTLRVNDSS